MHVNGDGDQQVCCAAQLDEQLNELNFYNVVFNGKNVISHSV